MNIPEGSLGPRPGTRPKPRQLSKAQARVLTAIEAEPQPMALSDLSRATGLHANTLRDHLDVLERTGLVERTPDEPNGRGRPRTLFTATRDSGTEHNEYAGLASALASSIHRTSPDPKRDAEIAGTEWGHDLAGVRTPASHSSAAVRREVVGMLDEFGFAPVADRTNSTVRLTRCPLLETAKRYPDVVCAVHLGIVRGAMDELGGDPDQADLVPFAEPGACRLHLARSR